MSDTVSTDSIKAQMPHSTLTRVLGEPTHKKVKMVEGEGDHHRHQRRPSSSIISDGRQSPSPPLPSTTTVIRNRRRPYDPRRLQSTTTATVTCHCVTTAIHPHPIDAIRHQHRPVDNDRSPAIAAFPSTTTAHPRRMKDSRFNPIHYFIFLAIVFFMSLFFK
jgi:hypothetical protein